MNPPFRFRRLAVGWRSCLSDHLPFMASLLTLWSRHPAYRRGRHAVVSDLETPWDPEAATQAWRGLLHGGMFASLVEQMAVLSPDRLTFLLSQSLFAHPADACAVVKRCRAESSGAGGAVAVVHVPALLAATGSLAYGPGHPVWAAMTGRDEELVGAFFKAAAPENLTSWFQGSLPPLHHAVRLNWMGGVRLAVAAGAKLTDEDIQGNPALHVATRQARIALIPELVALGADPNARNKAGRSPLGAAARANTTALGNPAEANQAPDPEAAPAGRRLETVEALLRAGANPHLRDGKQQRAHTPLEVMGPAFAAQVRAILLHLSIGGAQIEGACTGKRTRL